MRTREAQGASGSHGTQGPLWQESGLHTGQGRAGQGRGVQGVSEELGARHVPGARGVCHCSHAPLRGPGSSQEGDNLAWVTEPPAR